MNANDTNAGTDKTKPNIAGVFADIQYRADEKHDALRDRLTPFGTD